MSEDSKFFIKDSDVPKQWYNLVADLKEPMSPPLHPGTKQPIGPDDLAPLFPMDLIMQEVSQERYIDIPKPVLDAYTRWRCTPLVRARALERHSIPLQEFITNMRAQVLREVINPIRH